MAILHQIRVLARAPWAACRAGIALAALILLPSLAHALSFDQGSPLPVAVSEDANPYYISLSVSDSAARNVTWGIYSAPGVGTAGIYSTYNSYRRSASITYTPPANWTGTTSFVVSASAPYLFPYAATTVYLTVNVTVNAVNEVFRVDLVGGGTGASWGSPQTLQGALAQANAGDEIWVKAGTYKPHASDRLVSFTIPAGVTVYGGFAGTETAVSQRNWGANQTILNGDVDNDGLDAGNSRHVVVLASSGILDGFVVSGGWTDNTGSYDNKGGGILLNAGSGTVRHCVITGNAAYRGGGVSIQAGATPTFSNCIFAANQGNAYASPAGGGIYISDSGTAPTFLNCLVAGNGGGGLANGAGVNITTSAAATFRNTIVWNNTAGTNPNVALSSATANWYNCDIQGSGGSGAWVSSFGTNGGGNLDADPQFINPADPDGPDGKWMTADDGMMNRGASPVVNAGHTTAPGDDILGRVRPVGPTGGNYDIGPFEAYGVLYVVPGGAGLVNGSSWANAVASPADALLAARAGDEIWVKAGTYKPTAGSDRTVSFVLAPQVALYGGFAGNESSRSSRNWALNPTILSGNIDAGQLDSHHVVTGANGALLDGFIIEDGQADESTVNNFTNSGGGLHCNGVAMTVDHCVFRNNEASYVGGGIYGYNGARLTVQNTVFSGNLAPYGGGFGSQTGTGSHAFANCLFIDNQSGGQGAAALLWTNQPSTWTNCTVVRNTPGGGVAALHLNADAHTLTNCILWNNASTVTGSGTRTFTSSLVQGSGGSAAWNVSVGVNGGGNLDADPQFLDTADADGADGRWMSVDDGYRLRGGSPAANSGGAGTTTDILGQARTLGGSPDMGAYEGRCPVVAFASATGTVAESAGSAAVSLILTGVADYGVTVTHAGDASGTGTHGVQVGGGATDWQFPLYTYYHDARTQTIYLASELGGAATFRSLTLDVSGVPGQTMNAFTVRMLETASSAYVSVASWIGPAAGWTTVYAGAVTVDATGRVTLPFSTPFAYGGTSNLLVDISFNNSAYTTYGTVRCTDTGVARSLFAWTDSGNGDPLQWPSVAAPGTSSLSNLVPNLLLGTSAVPPAAGARMDADATGSVFIAAGSSGGTITVPIIPDSNDEANETLSFSLTAAAPGAGGAAALGAITTHVLTITDDDDAPTVQFLAATSSDYEYNGSRALVVALSERSDRTVTVDYAVTGGTASAGGDFTGLPGGTITFDPGETRKTIAWSVVADAYHEDDETVQITLSSPVKATLGANSQHVATVVNDDFSGVSLDAYAVTVYENAGLTTSATLAVTLACAPAPGSTVSVTFATSDAGEATVAPAILHFTGADWNIAKSIVISRVDDAEDDGDQNSTIITGLSVSGAGDPRYAAINPGDIAVTTVDDDAAGIAAGWIELTGTVTVTDAQTVAFTAATDLSQMVAGMQVAFIGGHPNAGVHAIGAVDDANDKLQLAVAALTPTGTAQTVRILRPVSGPVLERGISSTAATVAGAVVTLSPAPDLGRVQAGMLLTFTGAGANSGSYRILAKGAGTLTVSPTPAATAVPQLVTIADRARLDVVLLAQPAASVTIPLSVGDGSEASLSAGSLTFTTGNWATPQQVTVWGLDDSAADGDQGYKVVIGAASSSDPVYAGRDIDDPDMTTVDDDARGLVLSPASVAVSEGGTAASYTIALGSQPTAQTTVAITGSADFTVSPTQVVFTTGNWNVPQTISVAAVDDALIEPVENQSATCAVVDNADNSDYEAAPAATAAVAVTSNDAVGFILSASALSVPETASVPLRIRLAAQPSATVAISASLSGGAYSAVRDSVSPATLTFTPADWSVEQVFTVATLDDGGSINEAYSLDFALAAPPAEAVGAWTAPASLTCTNIDDDVAGIRLTQTGGSTIVTEGGSTDAYLINLTTIPDGGSTFVQVNLVPPAGVTLSASVVTWTKAECGGDWSTYASIGKSVTITAIDDNLAEPTQFVAIAHTMGLTDSASYAAAPALVSQPVQIDDNDVVGVSIAPTSGLTVTEAGAQAQVFVRLLSQPAGGATVSFTLAMGGADPDEASSASASVVFTSADWNVTQAITITGANDSLDDGDRSWTLVTGPTVSVDAAYHGLAVPDIAGATIDDDAVGVVIAGGSLALSEGGSTAAYTVRLASQPSSTVSITVTADAQVTASPATLTFTSSDWSVPQPVSVGAVHDFVDEASPHGTAITHAAAGGDYTGVVIANVTVSITDDPADTVGFTLSATSAQVAEAGGVQTRTLRLNSKPQGTVTVALSSSDTAVATVTPAALTFSPANWNVDQAIAITGVDDQKDNLVGASDYRTATVATAVSSTDPAYNVLPLADIAVRVDDDAAEAAGLVVDAPGLMQVDESGVSTTTFTVRLKTQPSATITVPVAVSDGAQGQASQGGVPLTSLVFTSANWGTAQSVVITGRDADLANNDTAGSPWVDFTVSLGEPTVSGGTDVQYDALSGAQWSGSVRNQAANAAPDCDAPAPFSASEDTPALATLTGIRSGQNGEVQVITVTATSSNPALIPDPIPVATPATMAAVGNAGTTLALAINPQADANGTATITVTIADDGTINGTAGIAITRTLSVTVTGVDDAPLVDANGGSAGSDATGATFTENGLPAAIAPDLAVLDVDSASLTGATIVLDATPDGALEYLSASASGLVSSWDADTRTLTISGVQPVAAYQAALRAVTYRNLDDDPATSVRTATITVTDGSGTSIARTASIAVVAVNDAPVLAGGSALAAEAEDTLPAANAGTLVSAVISGLAASDADSGALGGLAVTAVDNANGVWQWSPDDGATWNALDPAPPATAARLLAGSAGQRLRFLPAFNWTGSAGITVRAWDQTAGADGAIGDASVNGGSSALSAATATVTIAVTPVNDRPTVSGTASLLSIPEGILDAANGGTPVAAILTGLAVTDVDAGALRGLAIAGADTANGQWDWSVDDGATWTPLGAVSSTAALVLSDAAATKVRFRPASDFSGTAALVVHAWDRSSGGEGTPLDALASDACSAATASAVISVTPVNDAPVALGAVGAPLYTIAEDPATNTGTPVATLIDGFIADADAGAAQGIAVSDLAGSGTWQYSTNSGSAWNPIGPVSAISARLLTDNGTVLVRYVPALHENGAFAITYRLWDRTSGALGALADASVNGGATAFSSATMSSLVTVTAVNDAPAVAVAAIGGPLGGAEGSDIGVPFAISLADVDAGGAVLTLTVSVAAPDVVLGFGGTIANGGSISGDGTATVTLSGALADLQAYLSGLGSFTYRPGADVSGNRSITFALADGGASGAGGALSGSDALSISVGALNDPPVLAGAGNPLPTLVEDAAAATITGASIDTMLGGSVVVSDIDSVLRGLAVASVTGGGTWQYSTDGGSAWLDQPALAVGQAFVLAADGGGLNRLRYLPAEHENGSPAARLRFRAWDRSDGAVNASLVAVAGAGSGTSALSAAELESPVAVTPVNDAPTLDPGPVAGVFLLNGQYDQAAGATVQTTVADLLGAAFHDIDAGATPGIAIVGLAAAGGTWQSSTDGGASWNALAAADAANALLLRGDAAHRLRFAPLAGTAGSPTLSIRAWDGSSGSDGALADASATGGSSAFSGDLRSVRLDYGILVAHTGGGTSVAEGGAGDDYEVSLMCQPSGTVTVSVVPAAGLAVDQPSLTFSPGDWSVPRTVTVTAVDDAVAQGARSLSIAHVASGGGFTGLAAPALPVTVADNDTAGVVVSAAAVGVAEAGGQATFTVRLASQPAADATIAVSSGSPAEAVASPAALVFTAANWSTPQTVTVTGVDDAVDDGDVLVVIALAPPVSADAAYAAIDPADVVATVVDNDTRAVVAAPASLVTDEAGGTASLSVALATQPTATVTLTVASGSAAEASVSPATLVFTTANWSTAQIVTVTGVDDAVADGAVAYQISIAASGGDYAGLPAVTVAGINQDDDQPAVLIAQSGGGTAVAEGGGTDTLSVRLATMPSANVTVGLSGGAQLSLGVASLVFTPADWSVPQQVSVGAVNDQVAEGAHAGAIVFTVAGGDYAGVAVPAVPVAITDNDSTGIAVTTNGSLITDERGRSAVFQVVLTSQPVADVVLPVASGAPGEASVAVASLTFTAANWNTAQAVTVTGVDDESDDGDRQFAILVGPAASADPAYAGLDPADPTGTNRDDDTAGIVVTPTAGLVTSESGATATFTIVLTSRPSADVQIDLACSDTTEATVPASVLIPAAQWNVPQTVTVTGVEDGGAIDGDRAFTIATLVHAGTDPQYAAIDPADVAGINVDNDRPAVLVQGPPAGFVLNESGAGSSLAYGVRLSVAPSAGETVTVTVAAGTQMSAAPAVLVFTQADYHLEQAVTVTAVDDLVAEGVHAAALVHGVASSGGSGSYAGVVAAPIPVSIADDDHAGVVVSPVNGLATTETGGSATFAVVLASQPTQDVVIALASSDTDQGTVAPAQLVFTPANWSTAQTVTVTGADADGRENGDVLYSIVTTMRTAGAVDPAYAAIDPADVSVTNRVVPNPPTLNAPAGLVVAEDAGQQAIALTGIGNGQPLSETETVMVTASVDNPALVTGLAVVYTDPQTTGSVVFTPASDASGSATITVTASDGTASVARTVAVTVVPVNDAPQVRVRGGILTVNRNAILVLTSRLEVADGGDPVDGLFAATDVEDAPAGLVFTLLLAPSQGRITRFNAGNGAWDALAIGSTFPQSAISAGHVRYEHGGGYGVSDGFAFSATDGAGAVSPTGVVTMAINIGTVQPSVAITGAAPTWTEGAGPVVAVTGATVQDPDWIDFSGGSLTVTPSAPGVPAGTAALDVVAIRDQGTGLGQIGVSGSNVTFGGAAIGAISSGGAGQPLVVALNLNASESSVAALIANLTFDHLGRDPTALPRVLAIALDDGKGGMLPPATSATVSVQTVDDQPDLPAATFITVRDKAVSGVVSSSDPEGAAVALTLVSGTVRGTLSFPATPAATAPASAAFTYTPYVGESGVDSFVVEASDGTSAPVRRAFTVVISGGAGARPWIVSDPPMEVYEGDLLRYQVQVDGREIGSGADLAWELVGAPAGAAITRTGQFTASLLWTASRAGADHAVFSILVRDLASSTAALQELTIKVNARPGGGG